MARARDRLFGIQDWIGFQGDGETRYELVAGEIVAMNPPKEWHGTIGAQLTSMCVDALRDRFPCRVQQQAGIEIPGEPKPTGYIADLANDLVGTFTKDPYDGGCSEIRKVTNGEAEMRAWWHGLQLVDGLEESVIAVEASADAAAARILSECGLALG